MGWQPGYNLTCKERKQFEKECKKIEENFSKNPPHFHSGIISPTNKPVILNQKEQGKRRLNNYGKI